MTSSKISNNNETKKLKIYVILGSTGTGKTQLSIDLALKIRDLGYYPHIISCDSAQIYKNFDIGSAKVTKNEQMGIPHHMIDIVDVDCMDYSLYTFQQDVFLLLNKLKNSVDKLVPIIVGGTNLYMESVIFGDGYSNMPKRNKNFEEQFNNTQNEELYQRLKQVDPERAELLHCNDRKRILRSLEIYSLTGIPHSQLLKMKNKENQNYDFTFLWVSTENETLNNRLDKRVDKMVELGLKEEIIKITRIIDSKLCKFDFINGVQKCIGFKEFQPWIEANNYFRNEEITSNYDDIFNECINVVKKNTRRYAKSQITWINNRFVNNNTNYSVYKFDSTDINEWEKNVLEPSWKIVYSHLTENEEIGLDAKMRHLVRKKTEDEIDVWKKYICSICNRELNGSTEWKQHLESRSHRRKKKKNSNQITSNVQK